MSSSRHLRPENTLLNFHKKKAFRVIAYVDALIGKLFVWRFQVFANARNNIVGKRITNEIFDNVYKRAQALECKDCAASGGYNSIK